MWNGMWNRHFPPCAMHTAGEIHWLWRAPAGSEEFLRNRLLAAGARFEFEFDRQYS